MFLHVHTHVREDAIVLYGFAHDDERRCFEALLGAHGVGPALALAVLSALSPAALSTAVLEDDVDTLCAVPGRRPQDGGPAAHRPEEPAGPARLLGRPGRLVGGAGRPARAEARAALAELGYAPEEIRPPLDGVREDVGVEELLRLALRELAAR